MPRGATRILRQRRRAEAWSQPRASPTDAERLGRHKPRGLGNTATAIRYTCRPMQRQAWTWTTQRLPVPARMMRWGHFGTPVLIFPTAGGDFEEIERFQLIAALGDLVGTGRIKVYSIDGLAVRMWLSGTKSAEVCARFQDAYDSYVYEEVLHRIREDCQNDLIEPILAGASLGAFAAVSGICRHPDAFRTAIGLSGVYDLARNYCGVPSRDIGAFAPGTYVSDLEGEPLQRLRRRMIVLGSGEGDYENPLESTRFAACLEAKQIPCRLNLWGPQHGHTWATWHERLPRLLAEQL
jgi:esterase/lipase superfamily enzyme